MQGWAPLAPQWRRLFWSSGPSGSPSLPLPPLLWRPANNKDSVLQRCIPPFENAAFRLQVDATNTCGDNRVFCRQAGPSGSSRRSCEECRDGQFSPSYLTDVQREDNSTWWQSDTLFTGQNQVNLTLNLGKFGVGFQTQSAAFKAFWEGRGATVARGQMASGRPPGTPCTLWRAGGSRSVLASSIAVVPAAVRAQLGYTCGVRGTGGGAGGGVAGSFNPASPAAPPPPPPCPRREQNSDGV